MGHMKRAVEWERQQWAKRSAVHPVYMTFTRGRGWICEFTEQSAREPIRRLTVASADKVREMAERGGALSNLESRQMLEYGIESGRGGVTLKLTAEQLANLKGASSDALLAPVHDRQPIILQAHKYNEWLAESERAPRPSAPSGPR